MGEYLVRHRLVTAVMVPAILFTLGLPACGTGTDADRSASPEPLATSASAPPGGNADALMVEARALATKTNELEGVLWEGHLMMALIAPNAAASRPELAEARALLDEIRANEQTMVALLDQVARLDAGEEITTYAAQQKEIAELRLLSMADVEDLLGKIESLLREKDTLAEADLEKLFMEMGPSDPGDPLAHLEEKGLASIEYFRQSGLPERYYINNGWGEARDTPTGQSEEEAGAFPLADGIRFEGPMVAEEEGPPPKMRGSFETSLAEAMRAEQSALESGGWSVSVRSSGETRGVMTARNAFWEATLTFEQAAGEAGTVVVHLKETQ